MIEVSYEKFKKISRKFIRIYNLCYKFPFLKWFIPKRWYDLFSCPYYFMVDDTTCPKELRKNLVYVGKAVKFGTCKDEGVLIGIAATVEDYYYIAIDYRGHEFWITCVDSIEGF